MTRSILCTALLSVLFATGCHSDPPKTTGSTSKPPAGVSFEPVKKKPADKKPTDVAFEPVKKKPADVEFEPAKKK